MRAVPLLVALAFAAEPRLPAVVELYNQVSGHTISRGKTVVWAVDCSSGEGFGVECNAEVDEKNGYLRWADEGTGGGCYQQEAALFAAADKRRILVISHSCVDNSMETNPPRAWVTKSGAAPTELPKTFLPSMPLSSFFKPGCSAKEGALLSPYSEAQRTYRLPRIGTTVRVTLEREYLAFAIDGTVPEGKAELPSLAAREVMHAFVADCLYDEIELPFDAKTGTFSVGSKRSAAKK